MGKKRVLIVGGGFAGLAAARELDTGAFEITVVDPKRFFEHVPNAPAAFLSAAAAQRSLVDYPAGQRGMAYRQGAVVRLSTDGTKGEATLQGGGRLPFDYCLLASGSTYPAGIKPDPSHTLDRAGRLAQYAAIRAQIEAAASVVVVGGGSVGVEMAAEVAEAHPGKKVTLLAGGGLVERMGPEARAFAADWLARHGVEVVTGERVSDWGGLADGPPAAATLVTDKGRRLEADLVFKCVGVRPATALYAASLSADQLAADGSVAVEPTLQVLGWRNVFSAGDCSSVQQERTASLAGLVATTAARNIAALDQGRELARYPECVLGAGGAPPMVGGFTLGARVGVFQLGSDVQAGGAPAKIKGLIAWLSVRVAGGSRLWAFLYRQLTKGMVAGLAREAKKAAAAGAAAAAAPAAPVQVAA